MITGKRKKVNTLNGKEIMKACTPNEIWKACRKGKVFHLENENSFFSSGFNSTPHSCLHFLGSMGEMMILEWEMRDMLK